MNRAEQFWAQTLDTVAGPEVRDGLEFIARATTAGAKVRAWYRSGVCHMSVRWPGDGGYYVFGSDLMEAVGKLGDPHVF